MRGNRKHNFMKRIATILMAMTVIVSEMVITPMSAEAAESGEVVQGEIIFSKNYDMNQYWSAESKTAPTKVGYVFGGWYTSDDETTFKPLMEEGDTGIESIGVENITNAYAKFVPAYVLSIKAQNELGVSAVTQPSKDVPKRSIRIISSVDCKQYQYVGFTILLNNKKQLETKPTKKVFDKILCEEEALKTKTPDEIFGTAAEHFSYLRLDNISYKNDSKIIYARPYWITLDGTTVHGLAKYVHIEDGYRNYLSVPINFLAGESVAAGQLQMAYEKDILTFKEVENGHLFTMMEANVNTAGTVEIAGCKANDTTTNTIAANDIYANVRFIINDETKLAEKFGSKFEVTQEEFCDWEELIIKGMTAWETSY